MKIKCLLVDDEPIAREILETYIQDIPQLELVMSCSNAFEAMKALDQRHIQLIFLDINMPKLSGISLIRSLLKPPEVIFTTAYPEFAVEGFELEAIDYLLKPFSFERFLKAVNKALHKLEISPTAQKETAHLFIKSGKKLHKVNVNEILYFNAIGDFVKVHTTQKVIITNDTLKNIEASLPTYAFIRIHKSYIVAVQAIQYIEGNQVKVSDQMLPVGLTYKENLTRRLHLQ